MATSMNVSLVWTLCSSSLLSLCSCGASARATHTSARRPIVRLHPKATYPRRSLHDLQIPIPLCFAPLGDFLATIRCICLNTLRTRNEVYQPH
jgi:hypothetical protein